MKKRCAWCGDDPLYVKYHDEEWGVPLHDDHRLFEMLTLEGAQAGLSWITVLRKRENYRQAFDQFDPRRVAAYGAATRGSTLLHCCGITTDEIDYVADPDPDKHGRLLPGSRIPIVSVETLMATRPDDVVILPWPYAAEIAIKLLPLRQRGTQLWTPVPRVCRI